MLEVQTVIHSEKSCSDFSTMTTQNREKPGVWSFFSAEMRTVKLICIKCSSLTTKIDLLNPWSVKGIISLESPRICKENYFPLSRGAGHWWLLHRFFIYMPHYKTTKSINPRIFFPKPLKTKQKHKKLMLWAHFPPTAPDAFTLLLAPEWEETGRHRLYPPGRRWGHLAFYSHAAAIRLLIAPL